MGSSKKTPAKAAKTAAESRKSERRVSASPPRTPASGKKRSVKEWNYTHVPPKPTETSKNGRFEGRNLITWTRPRMAEKLLLHIQYECSRYQVDLPWDSIAHRLHPGSSGGAIIQHLNRLRSQLVAEGHLVPPVPQKPGSTVTVNPSIRGYVRKYIEDNDTVTTRPVLFSEPLEDRKFNLPDAFDNKNVTGSFKRAQMGGTTPRRSGISKGKEKKTSNTLDVDTATLDRDSDEEYNPKADIKSTSLRRSCRPKMERSYIEQVDSGSDHEEYNADYCEESHEGNDNCSQRMAKPGDSANIPGTTDEEWDGGGNGNLTYEHYGYDRASTEDHGCDGGEIGSESVVPRVKHEPSTPTASRTLGYATPRNNFVQHYDYGHGNISVFNSYPHVPMGNEGDTSLSTPTHQNRQERHGLICGGYASPHTPVSVVPYQVAPPFLMPHYSPGSQHGNPYYSTPDPCNLSQEEEQMNSYGRTHVGSYLLGDMPDHGSAPVHQPSRQPAPYQDSWEESKQEVGSFSDREVAEVSIKDDDIHAHSVSPQMHEFIKDDSEEFTP
ncbi:hypothetical protein VTK73DRAFT_42 [Phialemonium thermophilum]|uniref:Uncharacterized protein n=1 Tax=Phialemonium thermophilum TaxID=223376 RepID=A0ABR3Y7S1_9PEZI